VTSPLDADSPVITYLRELGASEVQIEQAVASGIPSRLALDLVLSRNFTLTTRQLAERLDLPLGRVAEMIHAMGLPIADPDELVFSEDDVELFRVSNMVGTDLAHVLASSLSRIADAGVATYLHNDPLLGQDAHENEPDELARAHAEAAAGKTALDVARSLGSIFIHLLREAVRWQRVSQIDVAEQSLARFAVGFVDLVGFTSMSRQMTATELNKVVTSFESTAFDIAHDHGGRVVKHIGDEVMFVALDAPTGVRIARALIASFTEQGIRPRGGISHGELLAMHGDYYGSVVNLAARLTDEAIPGELLLDAATADAAAGDADLSFEPAGLRMLKGFDEPIRTFSLLPEPPSVDV
jgi:class 3 adenylate cyclase